MPIRFQSVHQRMQASLPSLPNESQTASRLKHQQRKTEKTESSQKARSLEGARSEKTLPDPPCLGREDKERLQILNFRYCNRFSLSVPLPSEKEKKPYAAKILFCNHFVCCFPPFSLPAQHVTLTGKVLEEKSGKPVGNGCYLSQKKHLFLGIVHLFISA